MKILEKLVKNPSQMDVSLFSRVLENRKHPEKMMAAVGLYHHGAHPDQEQLKSGFTRGTVPESMINPLMQTIEDRTDQTFLDPIKTVLKKDAYPSKTQRLAQCLVNIGNPEALEEWANHVGASLSKVLESELFKLYRSQPSKFTSFSPSVPHLKRKVAFYRILRMNDLSGTKGIIDMLESNDPEVRTHAVLAFEIPKRSQRPWKVLETVNNVYGGREYDAILAKKAIPALIKRLSDSDRLIRTLAFQALVKNIRTYFPYHRFNFSRFPYNPNKAPASQKQTLNALNRWWKRYGER